MVKQTKYYLALVGLIILCMIPIGIWNRTKFYGTSDLNVLEKEQNLDEYQVMLSSIMVPSDMEEVYLHKKEWKLEELEKNAQVIAKVRVDTKKERVMNRVDLTKTPLIVEEVYKGDIKEQDEINVYEYAEYYCDEKANYYMYESEGGYQIMNCDQDYYVFLQELPHKDTYCRTKEEKNSYMFYNSLYSKIPVKEQKIDLLEQGKEYIYKEIKQEEILTTNPKVLKRYLELREKVKEIYGE